MDYLSGAEQARAERLIKKAAELARGRAACHRSLCGSVIAVGEDIIGRGWNSPPGDCALERCLKDDLPKPFPSDATCCSHAEQRAIKDALRTDLSRLPGSTLYFVRLDLNRKLLFADEPYCTICSKDALDVGIARFVLIHPEGIASYGTHEYNERSFGRIPSLRDRKR